MAEEAGKAVFPGRMTHVLVWAALVFFTALTVLVSRAFRGEVVGGTVVPLLIASAKASLVLSFFMNLKGERGIFRVLVLVVAVIFAIVFWLLFSDVAYRR